MKMRKSYRYIPNGITVVRLLLVPLFAGYLDAIVKHDCTSIFSLVLFLIIIGSDILDGAMARILKATSSTGARLDVLADSVYILSTSLLLMASGILPLWFFIIISLKLLEFIITSKILNKREKISSVLFMDKSGKAGASIAMLIPGILCVRNFVFDYKLLIRLTIYTVASLFLISLTMRISSLKKTGQVKPYQNGSPQ